MKDTIAPAIEIDNLVKEELLEYVNETGQVTVHVTYQVKFPFSGIRIWPTTYLLPQEGGEKSKLITKENISLAPQWTLMPPEGVYRFTLIFSPLPGSCKLFHLFEDIPEPGGFFIRNIRRNTTDVYVVELT